MSEQGHWPFNANSHGGKATPGMDHTRSLDNDKGLQARQAMLRQRMRFDRLIVGGRAHTKKSGLS